MAIWSRNMRVCKRGYGLRAVELAQFTKLDDSE
jgi:hypothetical protein